MNTNKMSREQWVSIQERVLILNESICKCVVCKGSVEVDKLCRSCLVHQGEIDSIKSYMKEGGLWIC